MHTVGAERLELGEQVVGISLREAADIGVKQWEAVWVSKLGGLERSHPIGEDGYSGSERGGRTAGLR